MVPDLAEARIAAVLRSHDLLCRQQWASAEKVFCAVDPLAGICAGRPGAWRTLPGGGELALAIIRPAAVSGRLSIADGDPGSAGARSLQAVSGWSFRTGNESASRQRVYQPAD